MDNNFLMTSVCPPCLLLGVYLAFIILAPIWMDTRKAYGLKSVLVIYNLLQIFFNFYLFSRTLSLMTITGVSCTNKYETTPELEADLMDLHYKFILLKVYDLLDTVLFILRKKNNQVSFLHIYHHVTMFVLLWVVGKYFPVTNNFPAGPALFFGVANTLVHGIMYGYYLISVVVKISFWWKKYITLLQLTQHCSLFILGVFTLAQEECPYPKGYLCLVELLVASVIFLFTSFYYNAYIKKSPTIPEKAK